MKMIAALWANIDTQSGDIYVKSSANAVTIRWNGVYYETRDPVSFSATLYPDGRIRLSYGAGNANGGLIGVSSGDMGVNYFQASASFSGSMDGANDIIFTPWTPLPEGLAISTDGVLSGIPTTAGTIRFHVPIMDIRDPVMDAGKTLNLTIISPTPTITPGTDTSATFNSTTAAAAVADINANKTVYIAAPALLDNTPAAKTSYQNMFDAKAVYTSAGYKIVAELTSAATNTLTATATNAVKEVAKNLGTIAADATGDQTEVSITSGAQPGFFYSISYGTDAGSVTNEGPRSRANAGGAVTLQTPPKASGATAGFYKVNVNVTDK